METSSRCNVRKKALGKENPPPLNSSSPRIRFQSKQQVTNWPSTTTRTGGWKATARHSTRIPGFQAVPQCRTKQSVNLRNTQVQKATISIYRERRKGLLRPNSDPPGSSISQNTRTVFYNSIFTGYYMGEHLSQDKDTVWNINCRLWQPPR
jgi:hypothetical protein